MIKLFFALLISSNILCFANTDLFELKTDKLQYTPLESALLVTTVFVTPDSSNYEVVIKSEVNDELVETIKIDSNRFMAKIKNVGNGPVAVFSSSYFIRDKYLAAQYSEAIATSEGKISILIKQRRSASDAELDLINEKIAEEDLRIKYYKMKYDNLLRFVAKDNLTLNVSQNYKNNSFIYLSSDRENRKYFVGEKMTLFAHAYLDIENKDVLIKAQIGAESILVEELLNNEFRIETLAFTHAQVGSKLLKVELLIRDQYRSSNLTAALNQVLERKNELVILIGEETDSVVFALYQKELIDLSSIENYIKLLLSEMEQSVETLDYSFVVENEI